MRRTPPPERDQLDHSQCRLARLLSNILRYRFISSSSFLLPPSSPLLPSSSFSRYLFQVLTLDRGTTHGLLAHSENDVGTLGSLPTVVDRQLLQSWMEKVSPPQVHE